MAPKRSHRAATAKPMPSSSASDTTSSVVNTRVKRPNPALPPFYMNARNWVYQFRVILLAAAAGYFVSRTFVDDLLPHGPARMMPSVSLRAQINHTNDSLRFKHGKSYRIVHAEDTMGLDQITSLDQYHIIQGSETVFFDPQGNMFTINERSQLLQFHDFSPITIPNATKTNTPSAPLMTAKISIIRSSITAHSRVLGSLIASDGETLYMCDSHLGLTRIRHFRNPTSKLEIVADHVVDDDGVDTPIWYADDIVMGPQSGKMYFTDASTIPPDRITKIISKRRGFVFSTYDSLHASLLDLLRGYGTGRVLEYDPATDHVRVLGKGFYFSNGIAVSHDESYLISTETFGLRVNKYYLQGDKAGTWERLLDADIAVGYLDGVDCHPETTVCYVAVPFSISPVHRLMNFLPGPISTVLRSFLMILPRRLAPKPDAYGGILQFHPVTGDFAYIQDATGKDIGSVASVRIHENKLYLGSLENNYIGVYQLD